MDNLTQLKQFRECVMAHLNELGEGRKKKRYRVFSIEISSQAIWGGGGDRDELKVYYITEDGWQECYRVEETGIYQQGNGVISSVPSNVSDEYIAGFIDGEARDLDIFHCIMAEIANIKARYPNEFRDN